MRRIGVAFPGDPAQTGTWSGTPSGVMRGLGELGLEPVAIDVRPSALVRATALNVLAAGHLRPRRDAGAMVRSARAAARACPAMAGMQSRAAPQRVRSAGALDAIVQIGAGYLLPRDVPIATLEDMTVLQTRTHPYLGWDALSARAFQARVDLQRTVYERATACCVTSEWAGASVVDDYCVPSEKVHVVGVGMNHVAAPVDRDWTRPRFLFVGIDWERKNGAGVLRAFARLREEISGARLDLVGGHPPLDQPGAVGHGVLRLDVPHERERVEALYEQATCFVMPSHVEAAGIAYVEAAAAGLPSIATSVGGSDYLVGDGGIIVDPHDDDALLAAMRTLADPETAARIGAQAHRRSRMFTWKAVAGRIVSALEPAVERAYATAR